VKEFPESATDKSVTSVPKKESREE
jgi:hypothetical protein